MFVSKDGYTKRQKKLISELGSEYKSRIDEEKRRYAGKMILISLFESLFIVLLFLVQQDSRFLAILVLVLFYLVLSILRNNRELNRLKNLDDYDVGLLKGYDDKRVVGVSSRKLKQLKISSLIISFISILIGALVGGYVLTNKVIDYDKLSQVDGVIKEANYQLGRFKEIEIKLEEDEIIYKIDGLYLKNIGYDEFNETFKAGEPITLLIENKEGIERKVYYVKINDVELLTKDDVLKAHKDNNQIGIIFSLLLLIIPIICLGYYLFYKKNVYLKNKENEYIDLDFFEDELNEIENCFHKEANNGFIKTKFRKSFLVLSIIILIIGVILFVYGITSFENLGLFYPLFLIGLILIIFGVSAVIAYFKNFEILDGNQIIIKRSLLEKVVDVTTIERIRIEGSYIVLYNEHNRIICKIRKNNLGVSDIINELSYRGIKVESK